MCDIRYFRRAYLDYAAAKNLLQVPNTHDIDRLVRMSRNHGSKVELTQWIEDHADMLTRWEVDTRYNIEYCVEKEKVMRGLEHVRIFLEKNGLKDTLRAELQDPAEKMRLAAFFPKNYRPATEFEWNVMYQVFRKNMEK